MPLFLSYEDSRRMLDNTVVEYEGRLTYVSKVNHELVAHMVDAETGERYTAPADFSKIRNPKNGRLGYVNSSVIGAQYIVRFSARVYKMGYSLDNLVNIRAGDGRRELPAIGTILEGLHQAYINEYPSFAEAYGKAKEIRKIVAYDRSFAVSAAGDVYYQTHKVGRANSPVEEEIIWTKKGLLASFVRQRPALNWR